MPKKSEDIVANFDAMEALLLRYIQKKKEEKTKKEKVPDLIEFLESLSPKKSKAKVFSLGQVRQILGPERVPDVIKHKSDDYKVKLYTKGLTVIFKELE